MRVKHSLIRSILLKIIGLSTAVITGIALFSYFHVYEIETEEQKALIKQYVTERVRTDSEIFRSAKDNLEIFSRKFLQLYHSDLQVTDEEFWSYYFVDSEGATRMKRVYFDGILTSCGQYFYGLSSFIGNNQKVDDPDFKRRLVLAFRVLSELGPAWVTNFANTHVVYPENAISLFYPTEPWGLKARANLPMNELGVIRSVNKKENPQRKPVWSGLYYDETANKWTVTYLSPLDEGDRHLITPAHDIYMSDLINRLVENSPDGIYNFIIREDGYLVAHPNPPTDEQKWVGQLSLDKIDIPIVKYSYKLIKESAKDFLEVELIENNVNDCYLAVKKLDGPNWLFVRVLPRKLIRAEAHAAALKVFVEGMLILFFILLIVYLVMRTQAEKPLSQLTVAAERIGLGDYGAVADLSIPLPLDAENEIGLLSSRFVEMATNIRDSQKNLERIVEARTKELEQANANLMELSLLDGLTGVHNRRALDRNLIRLFSDAEAGLGVFSIMMIDVDFFKLFNDTYGHAEGDVVLKQIAQAIMENIRDDDRVFRYGGEEFMVIFTNADIATASLAAERVVQAVRDLKIVHQKSTYGTVTISAGVVQVDNHQSPDDLIQEADSKLYQAKNKGRNCIVV